MSTPSQAEGPRKSDTIKIALDRAKQEWDRRPVALVVDDQAEIIEMLSRYLQELQMDVLAARDNRGAIEIIADYTGHPQIDITFLDLNLPDGWSTDTLREIRERRPAMPIAVITGYDPSDALEEILRSNLRSVSLILKPFKRYEIRQFLVHHRILEAPVVPVV